MINKKGIYTGGRRSVWKRDKNRCRCCDCAVVEDQTVKEFAGEIHHINKDEGDNRMANKILVCKQCHSMLHGLSGKEYVPRIKEITGIETEVIEDGKTFKMIDMAERGCSLAELKVATNYTTETVLDLLAAVDLTVCVHKRKTRRGWKEINDNTI